MSQQCLNVKQIQMTGIFDSGENVKKKKSSKLCLCKKYSS